MRATRARASGALRPASAPTLRLCKSVVLPFEPHQTYTSAFPRRESKAARELYHRGGGTPSGPSFGSIPLGTGTLSEFPGTPTKPPFLLERPRPSSASTVRSTRPSTPSRLDSPSVLSGSPGSRAQPRRLIERQASASKLGAAATEVSVASSAPWSTEERVLHLVLALEDTSALWVMRRWLEEKPHLQPEPPQPPPPATVPAAPEAPCEGDASAPGSGRGSAAASLVRAESCVAAPAEVVRIPAPEPQLGELGPSEPASPSSRHGEQLEEPAPEPVGIGSITAEEAEGAGPELPRGDYVGKMHVRSWRTSSADGWDELHLDAEGGCRWVSFRVDERPSHCRFDEECIKEGRWKVCGSCADDARAILHWEDGSFGAESLAGRLVGFDRKWLPQGGWD